jgi:hypothetical protein
MSYAPENGIGSIMGAVDISYITFWGDEACGYHNKTGFQSSLAKWNQLAASRNAHIYPVINEDQKSDDSVSPKELLSGSFMSQMPSSVAGIAVQQQELSNRNVVNCEQLQFSNGTLLNQNARIYNSSADANIQSNSSYFDYVRFAAKNSLGSNVVCIAPTVSMNGTSVVNDTAAAKNLTEAKVKQSSATPAMPYSSSMLFCVLLSIVALDLF